MSRNKRQNYSIFFEKFQTLASRETSFCAMQIFMAPTEFLAFFRSETCLCFVSFAWNFSLQLEIQFEPEKGDSVNQVWRIRDNNDFSNFKNFSHFENVRKLALTSDFQRNGNSSRTVCLLKEEKLLIEKLAVIIGGFYQPRSCLIKYLREKRILKCTAQGFRPIVCLCQIIACNSTHPRLETSLLATKRLCNYN